MYGDEDVERLKLLRRALESGHSIGMIASLPADELSRFLRPAKETEKHSAGGEELPIDFVKASLNALDGLDATAFESALLRATAAMGIDSLIDEVVAPLLARVGEGWRNGTLSIAQEHFASAIVRTHLERTRLAIKASDGAPRIIVATPSHQYHEIGAIMAAITAARMDWEVTYLGADLPAGDIATAAEGAGASAVGVSLVHPKEDSKVAEELRALGRLLPRGTTLFVGGEAAQSYAPVLTEIGAKVCRDLATLRAGLAEVRADRRSG